MTMHQRFVQTAGTISIGTGEDVVVGTGTMFGGADREGAQLWVTPTDAAPYKVGTVAAVDPRGIYDYLELPLVNSWEGDPIVDQPYELIDSVALASGTTQAAIYARFAAFLEQSMGLVGNLADDLDFSLVPQNSLFVDAVTRTIYQWRSGVLELVYSVGIAFNPRGEWNNSDTYDKNDLVSHLGGAFVSNIDDNEDNEPVTSPNPASDASWTVLPLPRVSELFTAAAYFRGVPEANDRVDIAFVSTVTVAADLAGSHAKAQVAATAETVFSLRKNGAEFGTLTFAISGDTGVFAGDETTFTAGDVLSIIGPATPDDTLAAIAIAIKAVRDGGQELDALPLSGGQLTGALAFRASIDVASAATCNIGAADSNLVRITGTTTIDAFDNVAAGVLRFVTFAAELTLSHGSIALPGADNIVTADGDSAVFQSLGSGNWRCLSYKRQNGKAVVAPAIADLTHSVSLADKAMYWDDSEEAQIYDISAAGRALAGGARGADLFKILSAGDTGANSSSAQPWFPTAGAVGVVAETTYLFRGVLRLSRAAGTTSHTTGISFGGTATLTAIDYLGWAKTGDANDLAGWSGFWSTSAGTLVLKAASTSATEQSMFRVEGVVRINAGGTFIPRFIYSSAPGGAPTVLRGTWFHMIPVGSNVVETAGTWS